jgi:hypothetical protein
MKLWLETDEVAERLPECLCERCSPDVRIPADGHSLIRYSAIRRWLVGNRKFAMITKFDSLYAGHTDLDNIGYGGSPINERRYSNAHLATALSKAESMATLMDGLGYNCFWMAEHHFQREGTECIPNTILMALHLAHRTKNIKIGCGFNITPMWHPLRLAEDFATADILTGGRIVFGVGRGYHTREVETFGSQTARPGGQPGAL